MEGDGFAGGPAFRAKYGDNALKDPSRSITKAIKRGAEHGELGPPDSDALNHPRDDWLLRVRRLSTRPGLCTRDLVLLGAA